MNFKDLALLHSANNFLNSYVRDFNIEIINNAVEIEGVNIPLLHYSKTGSHSYDVKDFQTLLRLICKDSTLLKRVENSISNMQLFLEENRFSDEIVFLTAEQSLLLGHNFHPCSKSRDEFSDEDLKNYGPELKAKFKLKWFFVKKEYLYQESSKSFKDFEWMNHLFGFNVPKGYIPYPAHPWQFEKLLSDPAIRTHLHNKNILIASETEREWYATSSMRSLYSPDYSYMLKFSMSVKMTNSVRHLQLREVSRGMKIQDAFESPFIANFNEKNNHFEIMHEPYFCAIKDINETPLVQTIVLLRDNRIQEEQSIMLATINQPHPYRGKDLLSKFIDESTLSPQDWFSEFIDKVIKPYIDLQANFGIYLGAHQQNLIVKIKKGKPTGTQFRDCQGIAFGKIAIENISNEFKDHFVDSEAAKNLFTYYLIINSVFSTIAAIARSTSINEEVFLRIFRSHLTRMKHTAKDTSVINYLLDSEFLTQKGNFRCNLDNINENTTENPLSIYNSFKNPLVNI